jgi:hypothetical protein
MREIRSSGSVRGASGDGRPYRERNPVVAKGDQIRLLRAESSPPFGGDRAAAFDPPRTLAPIFAVMHNTPLI